MVVVTTAVPGVTTVVPGVATYVVGGATVEYGGSAEVVTAFGSVTVVSMSHVAIAAARCRRMYAYHMMKSRRSRNRTRVVHSHHCPQ